MEGFKSRDSVPDFEAQRYTEVAGDGDMDGFSFLFFSFPTFLFNSFFLGGASQPSCSYTHFYQIPNRLLFF